MEHTKEEIANLIRAWTELQDIASDPAFKHLSGLPAWERLREVLRGQPIEGPIPGSVADLQAKAYANAVNKGFYEGVEVTPAIIPEKLCLIHSEISEALEEYRNGHDPRDVYFKNKDGEFVANYDLNDDEIPTDVGNGKPEGFAIELADNVIRNFDLAGAFGLNLQKAIETKMAYNATRPHRHGGKKA